VKILEMRIKGNEFQAVQAEFDWESSEGIAFFSWKILRGTDGVLRIGPVREKIYKQIGPPEFRHTVKLSPDLHQELIRLTLAEFERVQGLGE